MPDYLEELAKLRQTYGQRQADLPQTQEELRQTIYGGDKVLPTLRATRDDAIMALYDVDKRLADRYANPQSEMFIRDPYAREKLAAGQHQSVLGSVAGAERQVARREDILGNLLDKSLQLAMIQAETARNQHSMLLNEAKLAAQEGSGSDLASLLALLAGQGAEETRQPTEDERVRARRLAEARKGPVTAPAPQVGPLGAILNPFVSFWNTLSGRSAPPITKPNQNLSMDINRATEEDIAQALQDITGIVPPSESPLSGLGLTPTNLALLQAVSGASPKLGERLAEKYITKMFFPEGDEANTDITAPANREALNSVLDKVAKFSVGTDDQGNALDPNYTALEFYNDIVALYPELDAESIRQLLATISPSFATINY